MVAKSTCGVPESSSIVFLLECYHSAVTLPAALDISKLIARADDH